VLATRLTILMEHVILPKNGKTKDKAFADKLIEEYGIVTVPAEQFYQFALIVMCVNFFA